MQTLFFGRAGIFTASTSLKDALYFNAFPDHKKITIIYGLTVLNLATALLIIGQIKGRFFSRRIKKCVQVVMFKTDIIKHEHLNT